MTRLSALVVDDDTGFRESLSLLVAREGFDVFEVASLHEARGYLLETRVDVALVDLGLPDGDGVALLRDEQIAAGCEFVVITGNASVESAVQALREGALDYLTKPLDRSRLTSILSGVRRTREFKTEVSSLRRELRQLGRFECLVGRSPAMQQVYDLIARVSPTRAGVLLTGESGTGKELAAETIHLLSRRRAGPFLAVNCGAVARSLIESELFGHERGSFTGAEGVRRGYFEEANGGTLFLDEISNMSPELQGKLLRALETGVIMRVGGSEAVPVDVRVIAATNCDPAQAVRDGVLREDLYYRLNVFPIVLPPLRERGSDIELLADHFLGAVNAREGTSKRWSPDARALLQSHAWPGNVRELKNAVERAAILADSVIGPELMPTHRAAAPGISRAPGPTVQVTVGSPLEEIERQVILATLERFRGDKRRTAQALGIGLKTLYARLNVYRASGKLAPLDGPTTRLPRPEREPSDAPFVESAIPEPPTGPSSMVPGPAKSRSDR
jgi:DNA-binding NtrC family response regulator